MLRRHKLFLLGALLVIPVGVLAADLFQTIAGTVSPPAYVAADRWGYQTAEKVRQNFNTLNTYIKGGTGTPEGAVTAGVGAIFLRTDGGAGTTFYIKESGSGNTGWAAPGGGGVTASSTTTFTNKTLNAESTGNVVTITEKVWLPTAICQNATAIGLWSTPTSNQAAFACDTGSNLQRGTADFADGSALSIQTVVMLPFDLASDDIDVRLKWLTSATSGDVVWQVSSSCVADAEIEDNFNTATSVTDTAKGSTNQDNDVSITVWNTNDINACQAGELLYVKVRRDSAAGGDTLAATARLRGIELTYRRAM